MPYKLVSGEFCLFYQSPHRHVGSRPDGDSMWFEPKKQDHLTKLGDRQVDYNGGGFAQLRFEGIDALELHYKGSNHQKVPECVTARDQLLKFVGFTSVTYAPSSEIDTAVREATPDRIKGYILTRNADPFGRPVAFVFAGQAPQQDGSEVWLDPEWMASSLNARLISEGHAYPTYYTGLPTNLRDRLTALASHAESNGSGLWQADVSIAGAQVGTAFDLGQLAIWPKLYRRLFSYFADGNAGLTGFETWLRTDRERDDALWIISRGELGNMHDVFTTTDDQLQMIVRPEDMVIVPR